MASSSSSRDRQDSGGIKIDDLTASIDMNCPICFDLFSDPLLLRCGHTFCKQCTDRLIADAFENQQPYHLGTPTMNCPECRAEMPANRNMLVKNYRLADIINRFNSLKTDCKVVVRSPEAKPVVVTPSTIKCQTCQELQEPRHLFYCVWCSNGRTEPFFTCGTCGINSHGQHQLLPYAQMATPDERQAFFIEATAKIRDAADQLRSNFFVPFQAPLELEYERLRSALQKTLNNYEPVLLNAQNNSKLTKKQIEEQGANIGQFVNLCKETGIQLRSIETKHLNDLIALRDKFSSNVTKVLENFSNVFAGSSMPNLGPNTSSMSSESNFSYQPSPSSTYRRFRAARRRRNPLILSSPSSSHARNSISGNNGSEDGGEDDDL